MRKAGYEIPLEVITDVGFRQNLIERGVGVGDMVIQTSGSTGQNRIRNIPEPEKVKSMLVETRRNRTNTMASGGPAARAAASPGKSNAEQLEILGKLFDEGKLTQDEYDNEKRKLLG
jgi:hypothetical protein